MDSARRTTDRQISAMRREFAADYDQLGGSMYWMFPPMCTLRPEYIVPCPFT